MLDYVNSIPLAAAPPWGEVIGLGDALSIWYGADFANTNEILRTADRELRGVLAQALNDAARETLGREGQLKERDASSSPTPTSTASPTASPTPTATPSASPEGSASPKPSCTSRQSASLSPAASASPSGSPSAETRGRLEVASRVPLDAELQGIVDKAKTDMKSIVDKAERDLATLPAAEHGRSGEKAKPESQPGKAEEKKSTEHGKPSDRPGGKPSSAPGRP